MKVLVPTRSYFAKILGSAVIAMTMSAGAGAFDSSSESSSNSNIVVEDEEDNCCDTNFTTVVTTNTQVNTQVTQANNQSNCNSQQSTSSNQQSNCNNQQDSFQFDKLDKTPNIDSCSYQAQVLDITKDDKSCVQVLDVKVDKSCIEDKSCAQDLSCAFEQKATIKEEVLTSCRNNQSNACGNTQANSCQASANALFAQHGYGARVLTGTNAVAASNVRAQLHKTKTLGWYDYTKQNISNVHVPNLTVKKVDGTGTTLCNVWFDGNFQGYKLNSTTLNDVTFTGQAYNLDFKDATINNALFHKLAMPKDGGRHHCNFDNATLTDSLFHESDLHNATFKNTKLVNVKFNGSTIHDSTDFEGAMYSTGNGLWLPVNNAALKSMGAKLTNKRMQKKK